MSQHPLYQYVIAVIVVLAAAIGLVWIIRGPEYAREASIFAGGFLVGMFAMYIAVHVYAWK
jgi:hypothetical protein